MGWARLALVQGRRMAYSRKTGVDGNYGNSRFFLSGNCLTGLSWDLGHWGGVHGLYEEMAFDILHNQAPLLAATGPS